MTRTTTARRKRTHPQPEHATRERRAALGKAARAEVSRESHAEFTVRPDRIDPVTLLEGQGMTRVPELLPIRYGRMASSSFAFFRGAALPMAADLAHTPRSGLTVQACGDAHLANFGAFASPERHLVFDINDFDETAPGPWEWDVKRLAASLEIAARSNGYPTKTRRGIVVAAVAAYRRAMRSFAAMDALAVWYTHADMTQIEAVANVSLGARQRKVLARNIAKAQTKDNLGALGRFAAVHDGVEQLVIVLSPLFVQVRSLLKREAKQVSSTTIISHIRHATTGPKVVENCHPFTMDGRIFAHNGVLGGLDRLEARLGEDLALVKGQTDSERWFALITREIRKAGGDVRAGIAAAARWVAAELPVCSINFVLATPNELWAFRYPETDRLYVLERLAGGPGGDRAMHYVSPLLRVHSQQLQESGAVVVASERLDDNPGWRLLRSGELIHVAANRTVQSNILLDRPPAHALAVA